MRSRFDALPLDRGKLLVKFFERGCADSLAGRPKMPEGMVGIRLHSGGIEHSGGEYYGEYVRGFDSAKSGNRLAYEPRATSHEPRESPLQVLMPGIAPLGK